MMPSGVQLQMASREVLDKGELGLKQANALIASASMHSMFRQRLCNWTTSILHICTVS
jgi:hypothetical protein